MEINYYLLEVYSNLRIASLILLGVSSLILMIIGIITLAWFTSDPYDIEIKPLKKILIMSTIVFIVSLLFFIFVPRL